MRPHVDASLGDGETLRGIALATQRKTFSARMVALGVTDQRLIVQPLTRRSEPDGTPTSLTLDEVRSAWTGAAGSEWWNSEIQLIDAALTMRLKLHDGTKLTLDLMRGGEGFLGRMGGGAAQEEGVEALADWLRGGATG